MTGVRAARAVLAAVVTAVALAGCGGGDAPPKAGGDRAAVRADVVAAVEAGGTGRPRVVPAPQPEAQACTVVVLLETRDVPHGDAGTRMAAVLTGRGWKQREHSREGGDQRVFTRDGWRLDLGAARWPHDRFLELVADGQRPEGDTFTGVIAFARHDGCPAPAPG
ncbi:hypothetical protein [Streptomyces sp. enrichment culture]|uniref:hypothetical protein n=1 Tax=Streptomyces sp. enrichment culture TaxID=1795815 RepID=UPI003F5768B8